MADNYIKPRNVFPTTKMQPVNRLVTEHNLTRMINNFLDIDSYVLPIDETSFDLSDVVWNSTLGSSLVKLSAVESQKPFECVIHGYYFNFATVASMCALLNQQNNKKLVCRIIVDTSDENYPELFGEAVETHSEHLSPDGGVVTPGETLLDVNFRGKDIKDVYAETIVNGETKRYHFSIDNYWRLQPTFTDEVQFTDGYYVEYVTYYSVIQTFVVDLDGDIPPVEESTSFSTYPESREEYSLTLLCLIDGTYYIPLNSFPKFNTYSIQNIDGGLL